MGGCCVSQANSITENLVYENLKEISIKEKDSKGAVLRFDNVTISLTYPIFQSYDKLNIDKLALEVSTCVLPGHDPRGAIKKECQDAVFYLTKENLSIFGLFDGHGREGTKVAKYCCEFMKTYFDENFESFMANKEQALSNIILQCDNHLRKKSGIDARLSGTTGIVLVIDESGFHVASVGDSRAVLGTIPETGSPIEQPPPSTSKYTRPVEPIRQLKSISLSIDQKPNHELELKRIEASGGIVQQLTDEFGNKVGPYRVWQKSGTLPGLAMSRSIGDGIAKKLGVTAQPVYHHFPHIKFRDQFIIMASDGVWDVIENIEIVNFVERFRKKCLNGISPRPYPHGLNNTSIAQLVAEEARYRWFGICEEEDVIIDDISVIVIQMGSLEPVPMQLPPVNVKRKTVHMNTVAHVQATQDVKPGVVRGDLIRGSLIPAKDKNKKRVDPNRGSLINKEVEKLDEEDGDETIDTHIEGIPMTDEKKLTKQ